MVNLGLWTKLRILVHSKSDERYKVFNFNCKEYIISKLQHISKYLQFNRLPKFKWENGYKQNFLNPIQGVLPNIPAAGITQMQQKEH